MKDLKSSFRNRFKYLPFDISCLSIAFLPYFLSTNVNKYTDRQVREILKCRIEFY